MVIDLKLRPKKIAIRLTTLLQSRSSKVQQGRIALRDHQLIKSHQQALLHHIRKRKILKKSRCSRKTQSAIWGIVILKAQLQEWTMQFVQSWTIFTRLSGMNHKQMRIKISGKLERPMTSVATTQSNTQGYWLKMRQNRTATRALQISKEIIRLWSMHPQVQLHKRTTTKNMHKAICLVLI